MAYFECIIGSGSATAIPLIVTCSSRFAGTTITASKTGARTQTQICPSSSPYEVTFILPEDGTWTISGIVSGQTFSEAVTILPYEANLTDIPDGSTVTPTDDIQIWLHCANIWNKSYTTITQVLNDASTLQALIASNNAVDYMVRSTTWATDVCADSTAMSLIGLDDNCADTLLANSTWLNAICNSTNFESVLNVKVPAMTSATAPSGVVSANKNATYVSNYNAFDGQFDNAHAPSWNNGAGLNLDYQFSQNIKIYKIGYHSTSNSASTQYLIAFTLNILAKVNGNFEQIASKSFTQQEARNAQNAWAYFNVTDIALTDTIRANFPSYNYSYASTVNIGDLQYYGRASS